MALKRDGMTIAGVDWHTAGLPYKILETQDFNIPLRVNNRNKSLKGRTETKVKLRLIKKMSWRGTKTNLNYTDQGRPRITSDAETGYYTIEAVNVRGGVSWSLDTGGDGVTPRRVRRQSGYYYYNGAIREGFIDSVSWDYAFFLSVYVGGDFKFDGDKVKKNNRLIRFDGSGFVGELKSLQRKNDVMFLAWELEPERQTRNIRRQEQSIVDELNALPHISNDVRLANFNRYVVEVGRRNIGIINFTLTNYGSLANFGNPVVRQTYGTTRSNFQRVTTSDFNTVPNGVVVLGSSEALFRSINENPPQAVIDRYEGERASSVEAKVVDFFNKIDASVILEDLELMDLSEPFIQIKAGRGDKRKNLKDLEV